ncbi:bifunctional 2-polyprenyl-6-hydroxyphenol methylase/3-demethylubiquinol 3-O-methyltransferase UbiG [Lentzea sp. HUAS12]|uniref:class I SAM-dependent methyltransferase n=1 Tax=Lentzea sp. HUAS12 TaxID=2951806 RepID=UPI00209DBBA6|nr:methyltransferase domain-containing protein [Lentzea sp. HUAS12]USX48992.1 methyltransferase domain-containing protein [Lentzea sp. HUAS12]
MNVTNGQFWEELHAGRQAPAVPPRPNDALVDLILASGLAPGRALDLGAGSGGDALWLASLGWQVTAVDISLTAADRIQKLADAEGLAKNLTAIQLDLSRTQPSGTFDLVYACYLHTPVNIGRGGILHRAADLMGVGGTLVVVDHASTAPWSWAHRDTRYPTPEQTYATFDLGDDWEPSLLAARERVATGPNGETATVTDNLIVSRRVREQPFSARAERESHDRRLSRGIS